MSKKMVEKNEILKKEIEVKNMIIGQLIHIISEKKIALPEHILKILSTLYPEKQVHVPYDKTN